MENITYLFGAGASRNCLPIVSEMQKKVSDVAGLFEQQLNILKLRGASTLNQEEANNLIKDLNWLAQICDLKKNFSVDTFAKKLKLSGKLDEYDRLKKALTLYFTLQQKFELPDVRYDNFWASLLNEKYDFPNNIKILSWNYDFQMEMTYQGFSNSTSLRDAAKLLNIVTHKNANANTSIDKFTIFKLNGSATYNSEAIERRHHYVVDNLKDCSIEDTVIKATDFYTNANPRSVISLLTHLSFAWEHEKTGAFYEKLEEGLKSTTVLVVIGYSFPYFNREEDKLVLNKYMPNLKKVYFQDEKPDNIKERFRAINNTVNVHELVSIHDTYQFYFPNEL